MTTIFDQFDLTGTVGFVTGAGSGLGRAYAQGLSEAGVAVACVDIDGDTASETASALDTEAIAVEADVTSEAAIASAVEETVSELGGLDAAFANAGIGGTMAPLEEHPFDEWQSVLDVNLTGVFLTAREASRQMIDTGEGGTIVSTASIYGAVGSFAGTSTRPCQDSKHRSLSVQVGSDSIISQPANFGQILFGIQSCDGARRVLRVLLVQSNFGVRLLTLKLI